MHLGIAGLVGVLGRRGRIDNRRIDHRARGHLQPLGRKMALHLIEQPLAQIVLFEQMAETAHCGLVGYRLAAEINPDETAHRPRIVKRLGPMVMRVASFFPFQTTYYLNGHSFIEQELNRARIGFRKADNAFLAVADVAALQAAADKGNRRGCWRPARCAGRWRTFRTASETRVERNGFAVGGGGIA
jgi:hypothetical protein